MKRSKLLTLVVISLAMILTISAANFQHAAAAGEVVDLEIKNNNHITVQLTLLGINVYQFDIKPGKNTVQVVRGSYQHSYYACGGLQIGTIQLKLKNNELILEDCNKGGGTAVETTDPNKTVFTIRSRSHKTIDVNLVGQVVYNFSVAPFSTEKFVVQKGPYQWSYYDCGKLNVGSITVRKESELVIKNCTEPSGAAAIDPTLKLFEVKNNGFVQVPLTLLGLDSGNDYNFTVTPGKNKLRVGKGLYQFSYYACGLLHVGTVRVTARGGDLVMSSCSSSSGGSGITDQLVQFKLKNNTGDMLILQLNGIVDYLFTVEGSGEVLTVDRGYYQYKIWACGTTIEGFINVTRKGTLLKAPVCSAVQNN